MEHDFKYVEKTTSIYRVPFSEKHTKDRQDAFDYYYKIAVEKQKDLKIEMTPAEVVDCYRELNDSLNVVTVSKKGVKRVISSIPLLYRFCNFFKKVYRKLR